MVTVTQMPGEARALPVVMERHCAAYQAFVILRIGFAALPILAGIDKFFGVLVNWDMYLAPRIAEMLGGNAHGFMLAVGVIEIVAGLIVAFQPYFGGYLVTLWLWGIIVNLLMNHTYYDIALRDFGLSLAAVALARLSVEFGESPVHREIR